MRLSKPAEGTWSYCVNLEESSDGSRWEEYDIGHGWKTDDEGGRMKDIGKQGRWLDL